MSLFKEYKNTANFSKCNKFRYTLTRQWSEERECVFIMLNPSTADAEKDDPTIRRCVDFAKREGCGSLAVLNLYAFRTAYPKELKAAGYPIAPPDMTYGIQNFNDHVIEIITAHKNKLVIAAWGANAQLERALDVMNLLTDRPVYALGLTKYKIPRHPLYLKKDAPLIPFNAAAERNLQETKESS